MKVAEGTDRQAAELGGVGRRVAVSALGAIVLALAVVAGLLVLDVRGGESEDARRDEIAAAARRTAVFMQSVDYQRAQQGIDTVLAGLTGEARNQWATVSKTLLDQVVKNQSVSTIQSVNAAVVSMDDDSAEAIVYVTSVTKSKSAKDGVQRSSRWRFDLTRGDGRWLVSRLGLVP